MNKLEWMRNIVAQSEVEGIQLFQSDSKKKSKEWSERMVSSTGLRPETIELWSEVENGIVIECWRHPDSLGGLILLDVDWCKSSLILLLQLNALVVSPRSKNYMMKTLSSLGGGFEMIFDDLDAKSLSPVVIIDVADDIYDALLWRDVFAEEFELNENEGDLILVKRGGDLALSHTASSYEVIH